MCDGPVEGEGPCPGAGILEMTEGEEAHMVTLCDVAMLQQRRLAEYPT